MEDGGIPTERAVRYFFHAALLNTIAALGFTAPILLPRFEFPILLTEWPGIYIFIAYSSFILGGVLGMLGWSLGYYLLWRIFGRTSISRTLSVVQLVVTEIGAFGLAIFMFWGGYVGAHASHEGIAVFIVGQLMEFAVIPSALSIALLIIGTAAGLLNVILAMRA